MKKALLIILTITAFAALACGGQPELFKTIDPIQMPADGTFDGVYFSKVYGRMEISLNGSNAVGLYENEGFKGKIEGVASGNVLNFRWTQYNEDLNGKVRSTSGQGYFKYIVKEEGTATKSRPTHYIQGEWGYNQDNSGTPWDAVKFPAGTNKQLTTDGSAPQSNNSGSSSDPFGNSSGSSSSSSGPAPAQNNSLDAPTENQGGGIADDLF